MSIVQTKPRKSKSSRDDDFVKEHPRGYWFRTVRKKFYYFKKVADDEYGADSLAEWKRIRGFIRAGQPIPPKGSEGGMTVARLADDWLKSKKRKLQTGDLAQITFTAYKSLAQLAAERLGKTRLVADLTPQDFAKLRHHLAMSYSPHVLRKYLVNIKSIFRWGAKSVLITMPEFGPEWTGPSKKKQAEMVAAAGAKMFSRDEALAILEHADPNMKAMFLLSLNAGLGNTDLLSMPMSAIDLDSGWLNYARTKNGNPRRCPLWAETVEALQIVLKRRQQPANRRDASLVFLTRQGCPYCCGARDRIGSFFSKVAEKAGVEGRTFYDGRRTFASIGKRARDKESVQSIMGHKARSVLEKHYEQQAVEDSRLLAVTTVVRGWLYEN